MKILLMLLSALLINTGCLSIGLSGKINEQEEVGREWRDVTLKGRECGIVKLQHTRYHKYEFCGFIDDPARILEVLIPIGSNEVILSEHRKYQLEGELPIELETGFGTERNFKGVIYQRVNFEGEVIKVDPPKVENKEKAPEVKPLDLDLPFLEAPPEPHKPDQRMVEIDEALQKRMLMREFYRPEKSGNKWFLMTTRVLDPLFANRTGNRYLLSTPEKSYSIDASRISFNQRSWVGNKLLKGSYVITVPVDIVITPVIFLGIGCIGIYHGIF